MKRKTKNNTVIILAGGYGTRLSEETQKKPKPMVTIGKKPILWHIIKHYQYYGFKNFVICLGYKGYVIRNFFHKRKKEFKKLNIKLVDTGLNSLTATRLIKVKKLLSETFCLTYGDAVSNVNINKILNFHKSKKSIFTITGVIPQSRYGSIKFNKKNRIVKFMEKKDFRNNFVSGGYFVIEKKIFKFLSSKKNEMFEKEPMSKIIDTKKIYIFKHFDFWQCMDTLRDKIYLENLWKNNPKWKIW